MSESKGVTDRFFEFVSLRPDLARTLRAGVAFGVPVVICQMLKLPAAALFISMAAQTVALPDVRGAYRMRLAILGTMTVIMMMSAAAGVLAGNHVWAAALAMGFMAVLGSAYRHLSADYGPALSVSAALLFLLGLAFPGDWSQAAHFAGLIGIGGAGATLLQSALWLFRPQHPLRYAVAESWVAASDLVAAMREHLQKGMGDASQSEAVFQCERDLRATLDRTFVILGAAETRRPSPLITHLEEMRRQVVHYTMRAITFHACLESLSQEEDFARVAPTLDSVLKALGDAARSVAVTLITHRPENNASTEVRLQRCEHLIRVLDEELRGLAGGESIAQSRSALGRITAILPDIRKGLRDTVDQSGATLGARAWLPDLGSRSVKSLAAWINPEPHIDPLLLRYSLRMALLTMIAVAIYKGFEIPRGYWIAFTIVVVLQPDYGSTRQRAFERIGGTVAGTLLGSTFLWLPMPLALLDFLAIIMSFGFAYFLKKSYGVAVFFVTLMLVLITGTTMRVHLDFPLARLLCTLGGGSVALIAAWLFWPRWERGVFSSYVVSAVRSNAEFAKAIAGELKQPGSLDLLLPKRHAENANRMAAASLQRMQTEPQNRSQNLEHEAALTTYSQRLTRALTAATVYADGERKPHPAPLAETAATLGEALDILAQGLDKNAPEASATELAEQLSKADAFLHRYEAGRSHPLREGAADALITVHLAKAVTELRAMTYALEIAAPGDAPS